MDVIRQFEIRDVEQVANLHRDVFGLKIEGPLDQYHSYFSEQFVTQDEDSLPSLVCETRDGLIVGFLGVATRYFSFEGRKITAGLSSQFVVHPDGRHRLTGIHLIREFLNGRQDLSFTDEANDASRKIWTALGGSVSPLQTVHWFIPLHPVQLACARYVPPRMAAALSGAANVLDRLIPFVPSSRFQEGGPELKGEPLSTRAVLAYLDELTPQYQLRPHYSGVSLTTLIERADRRTQLGFLRGILLRDTANDVVGWYIYHCTPHGLAEVLQIASREDCRLRVIGHLTGDARERHATAAVGRLEPGLAEPLANWFCLLFRRNCAMLVHSRSSEILNAIHSGRAFISRLDGEWCLRFR